MSYPTDLTEKQWEKIKAYLEGENRGKHFRKHHKRDLVNAVLYVEETGCHWRQLPHDFPPYMTVWNFYRRARIKGLWDTIMAELEPNPQASAGQKGN